MIFIIIFFFEGITDLKKEKKMYKQYGNYDNLLSRSFDKNFVKATFSAMKLIKVDFTKFFSLKILLANLLIEIFTL